MIPLFKVFMSEQAVQASSEVLQSGYIGQGQKVEEFESVLSDYMRHPVVTTNSGTSALHLALHMAKGDEPDIEVLTTPLTCTATNWPILANGLSLKWVDIDPTTMNMDMDDLRSKITSKTKIIMVVHWGGYPVDLDELEKIKNETEEKYGFRPIVIEDCAHAFGGEYYGEKIGTTHGNFCAFSFQAIKHLTAIDGGMLLMPEEYHSRAKLLRWYGIDRETNSKDFRCEADVKEWGFKFHMNDVCASVGIANMRHIVWNVSVHQRNASFYDENLSDVDGVSLLKRDSEVDSSYWIYSMLVEDRDGFMAKMKECDIMVSQVHERNDIHTCVSEYRDELPQLDSVIGKLVSIPVGWWVAEEDTKYIVDCIKSGW